MEGNNAIGKAKLLETPMGNIAKELVKSGVRIGVSSRGAGSVNESGGVSGYNFVTVDLVAVPSAPDAMPNTVYESLEHSITGRKVLTLAEQVQQDPKAQAYFKKEFMKFLEQGMFAKK
jgi:F420-0:gamma-glutamyl ligase